MRKCFQLLFFLFLVFKTQKPIMGKPGFVRDLLKDAAPKLHVRPGYEPLSFLHFVSILASKCCTMVSCSVLSDSLQPHDCSLPGSSDHGDSPSKNTGVGCHALLQGIIPTQGSNPGLFHCRWILYHVSHQGSP